MKITHKQTHKRCRCLGVNYTFEQWCEAIRTHPANTPVMTFGKFAYNICDVCLTPNIAVNIKQGKNKLIIKTAQSPNGRWDYGIDCDIGTSSYGTPVSFVDNKKEGYETETLAITEALVFARDYSEYNIDRLEEKTSPRAKDAWSFFEKIRKVLNGIVFVD